MTLRASLNKAKQQAKNKRRQIGRESLVGAGGDAGTGCRYTCHHSRGAVRAALVTMGLVSIGIGSIFRSLVGSFLSDSSGVFKGDLGISVGNRAENRELVKPDKIERIKKEWET